jgi:RNA polymerase sigma-70 factor (ECF subfamily)
LCRTYWYPLYTYVRRRGHDSADAEDLTQAFFAHLLEHDGLLRVDPAKGRFRSYLLTALNHFLVDEWKTANRQVRGGSKRILSLDRESVEERYRLEPAEGWTAEKLYERRWAMTLLHQVLAALKREYTASRPELFDRLEVYLLGESSAPSYAETATHLGMTEEAVKAAVYRLRRRYRELLQLEIARTVAGPEEIEEELRALFAALSPEATSRPSFSGG